MRDHHSNEGVSRRDTLKKGAVFAGGIALLGGTTLAGTTAAHPKPHNHDLIWGDDIDFVDGEVRTYATTDPQGNLSSLGVYMDDDALSAFDEDHLDYHLQLPEGVDTHEFTFMGFHYNSHGHAPPGIYTVPHFDFHFYIISEKTVGAIETGPATYSIPDAEIPEDYSRLPVLDTDDDGDPDTPLVEEDMGEHLVDLSSPEFQEDGEFTHTMVYGAYDWTGNGVGHLTFFEPMITNEFFENLTEEVVVEMETPERYFWADDYPTQYVIEPGLHGGVYISLDGFTEFPGQD